MSTQALLCDSIHNLCHITIPNEINAESNWCWFRPWIHNNMSNSKCITSKIIAMWIWRDESEVELMKASINAVTMQLHEMCISLETRIYRISRAKVNWDTEWVWRHYPICCRKCSKRRSVIYMDQLKLHSKTKTDNKPLKLYFHWSTGIKRDKSISYRHQNQIWNRYWKHWAIKHKVLLSILCEMDACLCERPHHKYRWLCHLI